MSDSQSRSLDADARTLIDGRYLLSRELGRGSTGVVWEGRDLVSDEPVAVKILHAALLTSAAARARFRREVASAQALDHPHFVQVKAHGQALGGGEYLVMERLAGWTLGALLRDVGPLSQKRAIQIVAQILDAVAAAHRNNIVHRDLKPSNVILINSARETDFVKVCDFGLAKVFNPDSDEDDEDGRLNPASLATGVGELCGTPEYMAPEQVRGEALDGRADLYSVAVMLFEGVVGRPPFEGRTPLAVVGKQLAESPPRPTLLRPDLRIEAALEKLILRGLAKDRKERPSSAEVFRADLLQIQSDIQSAERRSARRGASFFERATLPAVSSATLGTGSKRVALGTAVLGLAMLVGGLKVASMSQRQTAVSGSGARPGFPEPALRLGAFDSAARMVRHASDPPEGRSPEVSATSSWRPGVPAGSSVDTAQNGGPPRRGPRVGARRPHPAEALSRSPRILEASRGVHQVEMPISATSALVTAEAPRPETKRPEVEGTIQHAEELLAEGQGEKACALGEAAVASSPGSATIRGFLGRCYMRTGHPDKARAEYSKYLQLAPAAEDARFVRAILDRKF